MITPPRQQTQWVLLSALVTVLIAALGSSQGKSFFFICLLGLGPLLAALHGRPRHIALLSLLSLALAAIMGWRDGIWLSPDHLLSALVVAAFSGGAVHLSVERHRESVSAHKRETLLKLLEQVAEAANHAVSVEAALKSCLDAICTHSHWPVGHAWVQDRENPAALVSSHLWHPDHHWAHANTPMAVFRRASEQTRLLPGECVCGRMLENGQPVWCRDAGQEPDFQRGAELGAAGLRGYFAFPVVSGGETAAVLEFFSHEARLPHPDLLDLLAHLGALLGRVVERQRAMAAITDSEARFRALAQSATDAVIIVDEEDRIVFWNPAAEKMFGHTRAQAMGRDMTLILPPRYHGAHHEAMARLRAAGSLEIVGRLLQPEGLHRDGREFPIEYSFSRWQTGGRKFFGATLRDVSERTRALTAQRQMTASLRRSTGALQVRNREIGLLAEMAKAMSASPGTQELYEIVERFALRLMPRSSGALYLFNGAHDRLEWQTSWGALPPGRREISAGVCPALQRDAAQAADKGGNDCHCCPTLCVPVPGLCLPLSAEGENFGLMLWHGGVAAEGSLSDKQQLLAGLAGQVAMALRNLRLREELQRRSVRDPLTGFFNRRHLEESLERELNRASRRSHTLALVMFDLDHFKRYNDSLGHPAGDALLREFCAFLAGRTRSEDILCRYGGDEFTLIMPETSAQQAAHWAEQLRTPLRGLPLLNQAGREVTVSFGVAEYPRHAVVSTALIAAADAALYRAKSAGRDRVETSRLQAPEPAAEPMAPEPAH
jgi:diguanylate cyclase (GGDEF)-like protein/PAS domain S-box-containing protein